MIDWADSFDHYGTDISNMLDGAWSEVVAELSTDFARTGAKSLKLNATTGIARRVFGSSKTTCGVALALYLPILPSINESMTPIEFRDGGNAAQARVVVESTGAIAVYLGPYGFGGNTPAGTSTILIRANGWNHLEAWCGVDASAGFVEVRLNGVTVVNVTGVNTDQSLTGEVSQYATLTNQARGADGPWYFDDAIALDNSGATNNSFIGDKKVLTDFPNADTADVDWLPSSGSTRYQMVDDADPDDDATYDEAGASGDIMGLSYPALDGSVVTVAAVAFLHRSRKTDAGTCIVQQAITGSGSGEAEGAENALTTAYSYYQDLFEVDPTTGLAWAPADVALADQILTRTS